jgi:Kdo2-lipid IVA lauroyltransferase/acyltransferase
MYYLGFGIFYLLSLLPFWVLYRISDVASWLLCHAVGYRRKTIEGNIQQSFPLYTTAQVKKTKRLFYRNFVDNWLETLKLLSISKAALKKRISGNFEVFEHLQNTGRPASMIAGHFFNWEYLNAALSYGQPMPLICVYMPITDKNMDKMFKYMRARFGSHLMAATQLTKEIIGWRKKQYVIGLVADQSPSNPTNAQWLYFLNRPTAFLTGPERNAQVFNQIPVYVSVCKPKRGHYHFQFEPLEIAENDRSKPGVITSVVAHRIEADILAHPDIYLWSHRRWKHPWESRFAQQWIDDKHAMPAIEHAE